MYGLALRPLVRRVFAGIQAGDPHLVIALAADDIHFTFPGRSPWTADVRTKPEFTLWVERFAHFRPQFEIHDVITTGPPWDVRVCASLTDRIGQEGDGRHGYPYVNDAVCLSRLRWGRLTRVAVYLDTQAVSEFFGTQTAEEFFVG